MKKEMPRFEQEVPKFHEKKQTFKDKKSVKELSALFGDSLPNLGGLAMGLVTTGIVIMVGVMVLGQVRDQTINSNVTNLIALDTGMLPSYFPIVVVTIIASMVIALFLGCFSWNTKEY